MKLIDLFPQQQMKATLSSTDMVSTFAELLQVIGSIYSALPADEQDDLCDRLVAREKLATTVLAEGIPTFTTTVSATWWEPLAAVARESVFFPTAPWFAASF